LKSLKRFKTKVKKTKLPNPQPSPSPFQAQTPPRRPTSLACGPTSVLSLFFFLCKPPAQHLLPAQVLPHGPLRSPLSRGPSQPSSRPRHLPSLLRLTGRARLSGLSPFSGQPLPSSVLNIQRRRRPLAPHSRPCPPSSRHQGALMHRFYPPHQFSIRFSLFKRPP
jgi:hypothetical protein